MDLHQLRQCNQELSILNAIAQGLNKAIELVKSAGCDFETNHSSFKLTYRLNLADEC